MIGWIEGPSSDPKPIEVVLRNQNTSDLVVSRSFPSMGSRIVLLRLPQTLAYPLVWESSYQCVDPSVNGQFGLFGAGGGPSAISLLVVDSVPDDSAVHSYLKEMLNNCGTNTSVATITGLFELRDVLSSRGLKALPVVCH